MYIRLTHLYRWISIDTSFGVASLNLAFVKWRITFVDFDMNYKFCSWLIERVYIVKTTRKLINSLWIDSNLNDQIPLLSIGKMVLNLTNMARSIVNKMSSIFLFFSHCILQTFPRILKWKTYWINISLKPYRKTIFIFFNLVSVGHYKLPLKNNN